MADTSGVKSATATATATATVNAKPSRLQRRRPASLNITPSSWNAAIPLLSPLASSPPPLHLNPNQLTSQPQQQQRPTVGNSSNTQDNLVFKNWQHPAAPFSYDSASFKPKFFVPV